MRCVREVCLLQQITLTISIELKGIFFRKHILTFGDKNFQATIIIRFVFLLRFFLFENNPIKPLH
jgi:hypothetical protein